VTSFADRFAPFDLAYLDAASQGPLPLAAVRAGREALALKERPYRIPSGLALTLTAEVRALYSRLFSCREEAVALTTGAGAAVNAVARGLDWKEGDEVVLPDGEFPSNDWPWRLLARCGVRVVRVKPPERAIAVTAEGLAAAVTPRTRVVAFAHVSYLHGGRLDPAPVVAAARAAGALTVVDGSQAAGAVPFDFGASGVDVYTACAYKHLLGPYGSAVALFSPAALERLGSGDLAWQSVKGSEDVSRLPRGELELRPGAVRFDAHEAASFGNLMPLADSLRLILEATPHGVQAHARALGDRILAKLPAAFVPASPLEPVQRSHIVCVAGRDPRATAAAHARLLAAKIQVALRGDRLRISPHLHNSDADVERLLAVLASE